MRPGRLYDGLSWGAAALVTAILVASWVSLYFIHANGIAPGIIEQIDRKTIAPKLLVEIIGFSALGIAVLGVVVKTWRRTAPVLVQETIQAIRAGAAEPGSAGGEGRGGGGGTLKPALTAAAKEIATGGMRECEDFQQWFAHLLSMWGFIGLFLTTSLDAIVNRPADPLPLLHPVRLLGNVTGIMFMAGLTLAIARRALLDRVRRSSKPADWMFLVALWGTGATGFAVQWCADRADAGGTAWLYVTHLIFIGVILATAPWTKFLHAVWRPSWVLYRAVASPARRP